jgi:small subunit ribosomal protein S8
MSTDKIADVLTRIRNAYLANHKFVMVSNTNLNHDLCCTFYRIGLIKKMEFVRVTNSKNKGGIWLQLNCTRRRVERGNCSLNLKRISKPTRRIYRSVLELPKGRAGAEYYLISTSGCGILTDGEARSAELGGEVLCWISMTK